MLCVRRLLVEEGMSLTSCLRTATLETLDFGEGRGLCDREDNRRGDLCLTTSLSITSKSSLTASIKSKNMLQLTSDIADSWRLI